MPAAVMQPLVDKLSRRYIVRAVSLPGFKSDALTGDGLTVDTVEWSALVDALSALLMDEMVTLVGWSLGGHLATRYAAIYPQQVHGVLTMASNPCFVQGNDWPDAMPLDIFSGFLEGINHSGSQTLKHFAMLCSQGGAQPRKTVRFIRKMIADSSPDFEQLSRLLALLGSSDTRSQLADIICPITHLTADNDALIPATLFNTLYQHYPEQTIKTVEGGHTFWMDNPDTVVRYIDELVQERHDPI